MATATESEIDLPIIELEKHYEVVDGLVVVEPPLGAHEGSMASLLDQSMGHFARSHRMGRVVTEVLFVIAPDQRPRRRPDVAFVSQDRWPINRPVPREAAWDVIPDIAVEITSPTDLIDDLMDKLQEYFVSGVRLVWVVYPKHQQVYAYESTTSVRILRVGDEMEGGVVHPGFRMKLAALFQVPEDGPTPSV